MEMKQGRPASVFPDQGAGHTVLDFAIEAWIRAVQSREPRAPGKSGMLTAIKQLTALSVWTLREAVSKGALGYIEPALRFVLHVSFRKRLVVRQEEDTWCIAMQEEIAKLVAIMILAETKQYVSDKQWAYQRGGRPEMWPAC